MDVSGSGEYEIEVEAPRVKFEKVRLQLSPSTKSLPEFIPAEVELCGNFVMNSSLAPLARLPAVEVASGPSVEASIADDSLSAKFCVYLTPKKHTLRLVMSPNAVRFAPVSINVDISSSNPFPGGL